MAGLLDKSPGWITSRTLFNLSLAVFGAGALLLCLSFVLGIDSIVTVATGSQTGYAHATNWNLNLLFFVPLIGVGLAWLIHVIPTLFAGLQEHAMLRRTGSCSRASKTRC